LKPEVAAWMLFNFWWEKSNLNWYFNSRHHRTWATRHLWAPQTIC